MSAVAERTVVRPNPKGDEAELIYETELYDTVTGERIPKGWERGEDTDAMGRFTIPGPEVVAYGLEAQYAPKRPGRYVVAGRLEGRVW